MEKLCVFCKGWTGLVYYFVFMSVQISTRLTSMFHLLSSTKRKLKKNYTAAILLFYILQKVTYSKSVFFQIIYHTSFHDHKIQRR